MRLLLDENVANKVKEGLIKLGIKDVKHINDIKKGMRDKEVFELAKIENRIIITGDDDFKDNNFKYKVPIIWITPKARKKDNIPELIKWILDNIDKHNVNISTAFINIKVDEYYIEYRNKEKIFGKIKKLTINYNKIKLKSKKKKVEL